MKDLPLSVTERLRELIYDERAVAYLKVDSELRLVSAGGRLDHYGLADLRLGEPAVEQAFFLEGLLPLVETPCLFPAVEMAKGRAADLHLHLDTDTLWVILLDVTDARDAVRRMQQRAYDMTLLQEKEAQLNQRLAAANSALTAAQEELIAARDAAREALRRKEIDLEGARTLQLALAPPTYRGLVGGRAVTLEGRSSMPQPATRMARSLKASSTPSPLSALVDRTHQPFWRRFAKSASLIAHCSFKSLLFSSSAKGSGPNSVSTR